MNKIAAFNDVTDKSMEVLYCITMISHATKILVTSPEQQEHCINIISSQASNIEQAFEEYKSSILNAVKNITSKKDDNVSGFKDNNGVRL